MGSEMCIRDRHVGTPMRVSESACALRAIFNPKFVCVMDEPRVMKSRCVHEPDNLCLLLQIHDKNFQYKEDIALRSFSLGSRYSCTSFIIGAVR